MPRVDVTPYYENTTQQAYYSDAELTNLLTYVISPVDGFVIHDKELDMPEYDENFNETGNVTLGFTGGSISVAAASYDFEANPREIYAIPRSEVPAPENQIFGGGDNDHEVMAEGEAETVTE